jgi:hypothetical protein
MSRGMAIKYILFPPSVAPLLEEYGDWGDIPDTAWAEYIAALRSWLMYADPPKRSRKPRVEPVANPP